MIMAPTEKQINFVAKICDTLNITNFPSCSKEYTKLAYSQFIKCYKDVYYATRREGDIDEDSLYFCCENDIWCEHY